MNNKLLWESTLKNKHSTFPTASEERTKSRHFIDHFIGNRKCFYDFHQTVVIEEPFSK